MPATRPAKIFSRRLRRCFLFRGPLPLGPPGREPAGRGGRGGRGGPPLPLPLRAAVVRGRPPAGGRAGVRPPPPPPVLRVRVGAGRRTDPAREATGEVSSWVGTRNPSLTCLSRKCSSADRGPAASV